MPLIVSGDEMPEIHGSDRPIETKWVYGKSLNLMFAQRAVDYHSSPHIHDSEQLNYCLEGKIWIFVEDEAYLMEPGDFSRVPTMAVHWSKVEEGPCKLIEAHSPPLTKGRDRDEIVGLFNDDEEPVPENEAANIWVSESYADKEEEMMEAYLDST